MSDGGKGSRARPLSVPVETFHNNFDAIFGKKKPQPVVEQKEIPNEKTNPSSK